MLKQILIGSILVANLLFANTETVIDKLNDNDILIKTAWNQPTFIINNITVPEGCVNTALGQIFNFYKVKIKVPKVKSFFVLENFNDNNKEVILFENNVEKILDFSDPIYENQKENLITLAKYRATDFSNLGSGSVPYIFDDRLNILAEFYTNSLMKTQKDLDNLLSKLKQKISVEKTPVIISDTKYIHCYILDGYKEINNQIFIHVNFGWGGYSDGWYRVDDINLLINNNIDEYVNGLKFPILKNDTLVIHSIKICKNDCNTVHADMNLYKGWNVITASTAHPIQINILKSLYSNIKYIYEYNNENNNYIIPENWHCKITLINLKLYENRS